MAFVTGLPVTGANRQVVGGKCPTKRPAILATPSMTLASSTVFKDALLEKVGPLNFGRAVADDPKEQAEIEELVRQVEAANKSLTPGSDPNLSGAWKMVYTTARDILAVDKPSFLQGVDIVQAIDAATLSGSNAESLKIGPFTIENKVNFKLEPVSSKRFDVNFVEFVIGGLVKFDVEKNDRFTGWLEVTYLDEDLRISRGNKGNLFVLVK